MMFSIALPALLAFISSVVASVQTSGLYHPRQISYHDLLNQETTSSFPSDLFMEALTQDGIISISNIPGYASQKKETLKHLHDCAMTSSATQEHIFSDGTTRLTMATHTVPGPGGQQSITHDDDNVSSQDKKEISAACSSFSRSSNDLRRVVNDAIAAFSNRLGSLLDVETPLLSTRNNEYDFDSFASVVENGEHLEHFHSYQRKSIDTKSVDDTTISMHTDQGLFIAFAPAITVDVSSTLAESSPSSSASKGDFYIETRDGSHHLVDFEPDDLVIMLGDGVNQFVNPKMKRSSEYTRRQLSLRATPHSLTMNQHDSNHARVWYGRMILPPSTAIHPKNPDRTFGDVRRLMIDASLEDGEDSLGSLSSLSSLGLGCSGSHQTARQLEEATCAAGSTYCWHRCMEHADYEVSEEICAERNLRVQCINPRGQLYRDGHGDFYPACSNTTQVVTDYPTLERYPPDEMKCDERAWETFSSASGYDFVVEGLGDNRGNRDYDWDGFESKGGNVTIFMWNVIGDDIEGRLVFNGLFGYLAVGFAHPEGKHNGMNGASIIMAVPGGNYSAMYGLDMGMQASVNEYVIDLDGSSFRHWSEPLAGRDLTHYNIESNDCFTALTFKTDNINDIKFNISGTDDLVWAANGKDMFCGYHGRGGEGEAGDRDRFVVEWKTGEVSYPLLKEMSLGGEGEEKTGDNLEGESSASSLMIGFASLFLSGVVGMVVSDV